jgi:glycosyltransferase involved in cell wall biosynthesis
MISIIIPTFNEEKAIEKTLRSLKGHISIPDEIIVTDGGSTDRTIEIAKAYADQVVIHPKEKKQTISSNRNFGARHAKGEYLAFVDSDCIIGNPDFFFKDALKNFHDHPDIVALTCFVGSDPAIATFADNIIFGIINRLYQFFNNVIGKGFAVGKFQMMKKEAFENVGGFREDLVTGEDNDMFNRLSKIGKTRMAYELKIYHSNRRARKWGWPKLLWIWTIESVSIMFRNKAISKVWTDVR